MKDHLILNDSIYAERQYPLELLPPQSDFQGKIFLRKNFAWKSDWGGRSSRG